MSFMNVDLFWFPYALLRICGETADLHAVVSKEQTNWKVKPVLQG